MHHTLEISDILGSIFSFTDVKTNAACALVCKAWLENALDILWYRIARLEYLLRILGPMGEPSPRHPHIVTFLQNHIANERWDRFSFYSRRIRHLEVTNEPPELHQHIFSTLSIARPMLHLLPNIIHLSWSKDPSRPAASLVLCLLFLTPTLKSLSVDTGYFDADEGDLFAIDNFFKDVLQRSPQIETLEFLTDIPFHNLGPSLSNFLVGLTELKAVALSDHLLASDVITALAKSPHLQSICLRENIDQGEVDDLQNFMPVVEPGGFPCLKEIDIKAHLWNVMSFLQSDFPTARLRRLSVRTLIFESSENVASFFGLIADICPDMGELDFVLANDENPQKLPLPFENLEPLLQRKSMTSFSLTMPMHLDVDNDDIEKLAAAWPCLRKLRLCPTPVKVNSGGNHVSFGVMKTFAECCPLLQELELLIESYSIPPSGDRKLLPELQKLNVGLVDSSYAPEDLACFITDITPSKCSIWGTSYVSDAHLYGLDYAERRQNDFLTAFNLIPTLRTIHAQYRDRLRALEAEVDRLSTLVTSIGLS